jgi:hypothetical protein
MPFTTRPNPHGFENLEVLRQVARPATRLHPRRSPGLPPNVSKIGGEFLWPADEALPICPDQRCPAVPVLQLFRSDIPRLPFPPGCDLFQLLWYPQSYDECGYQPKLELRWWDSRTLKGVAEPDYVNHDGSFAVEECAISPEEVWEFPDSEDLSDEQWAAVKALGAVDDYQYLSSICPGTKVGGYANFSGQDPWTPVDEQGRDMQYLLTISDDEWDRGSGPRWMPIEQDHPPVGRDVVETTKEGNRTSTQIITVYTPEEEAQLAAWTDERLWQHEQERMAIGTYLKKPLNVFIASPWSWKTA